mmetsp:Transcript_6118/g.17538  ORF Transcript_6118/g.17538 Transcript_6118/m.17538 type:complete len:109 (-) Transcript_6118:181-507(-)
MRLGSAMRHCSQTPVGGCFPLALLLSAAALQPPHGCARQHKALSTCACIPAALPAPGIAADSAIVGRWQTMTLALRMLGHNHALVASGATGMIVAAWMEMTVLRSVLC